MSWFDESHFIDEQTEAQRGKNDLLKVTAVVTNNGRANTLIPAHLSSGLLSVIYIVPDTHGSSHTHSQHLALPILRPP